MTKGRSIGIVAVERLAGIVCTMLAIYLHLRCLTHAGPLWRDEANTIAVATKPSWGALVGALEHESFPILSFAIVRGFAALAGGADLALRVLGLLVGLGVLAVLWVEYRSLRIGVPLFSLSLFALNPVVIRWGDSLRAYGFGTLLGLLLLGALFRVSQRPDARSFALAVLLCVLSLQCMYQSSILLLCACVGALLAAPASRRIRVLGVVAGIGACAALSLLPYRGVIARARDHFLVITLPADPLRVLRTLWVALRGGTAAETGSAGTVLASACVALYCAVFLGGLFRALRRRSESSPGTVFGVCVLALAPVLFLAFLIRLRFNTEPWYFIALMGPVALACDLVWDTLASRRSLRVLRIAASCLFALLLVVPAARALAARQTNMDLVARELEREAGPQDLVLVYSWYFGVSFQRYYHGATPWTTVPPLADVAIHRFDLVKEQMKLPEPMRPIEQRVAATLGAGHRVWVVGFVSFPPPGMTPRKLPPPPLPQSGWNAGPYLAEWETETGTLLRTYGAQGEEVRVPASGPVSRYEDVALYRIDGRTP